MPVEDGQRRRRARQACLACNARRVKCNVTQTWPCDNCLAGNVACETRESRRGKHPRKPRRVEHGRPDPAAGSGDQTTAPQERTPQSPRHHEDEVAASRALAALSTNSRLTFDHGSDADTRAHLNAGADLVVSTPSTSLKKDKPLLELNGSRQEDDGAVFLGESSSLRYISGGRTPAIPSFQGVKLRHAVPNAVKADALMPPWEAERRMQRINALKVDGAFSFPSAPLLEHIITAYFQWFHPCFAIIDESDFRTSFHQGTVSPLLLQAVLFLGVIHCEDSVLRDSELGSRQKAKYLFYNRAKDIYDADYEPKKIIVIQALFLLSFWRAGALLEKDVRHWLGIAISLAQTKALHRTAADADSAPARLRKRIWWSIYIRERQCAAALGLPHRIRDEDCDIEWLARPDFQDAFDESKPHREVDKHVTYAIGMTELAHILGKIVHSGYLPNKSLNPESRDQLRKELSAWKQRLPPVMQHNDFEDSSGFQACMLHLAYNNLLILLHRSDFVNDTNGNEALQAAARNARIIEDMLAEGHVKHAQVHAITNLFNTLCIHVVHLRRSSSVSKTIAEHRAKLCLLGLQELQHTWEVTNWVLQLFFQYLDHSTAARLSVDDGIDGDAKGQADSTHLQSRAIVDAEYRQEESSGGGKDETALTNANTTFDEPIPWSWTADEANQFLFTQIENDFAFGEGGILEWSTNAGFDDPMTQLKDYNSSFS